MIGDPQAGWEENISSKGNRQDYGLWQESEKATVVIVGRMVGSEIQWGGGHELGEVF